MPLRSTALDFLLPIYCPGCFTPVPKTALQTCTTCAASLEHPTASDVDSVLEAAVRDLPGRQRRPPNGVALWFYHRGGPVPLIHRRIKYGGASELGLCCGELLGERLVRESERQPRLSLVPPVLVPVPLHAIRMRERGYNQAETIAVGIARRLGLNVDSSLIRRRSHEASQVGRSRRDRLVGLSRAFEVVGDASRECPIILVDDVITTGATVLSAASALREAGFSSVTVAALGLVGN